MDPSSPLYPLVRGHYLFSGLSDAVFADLAQHMHRRDLDKGEVLFHRGEEARYFYLVGMGFIELSLVSPTGEKKIIEIPGPGRTFAEAVAFMGEQKYPVTAEALGSATVCQIANQAYVDMLSSDRDACMRLIGDLSRHLHARVQEIEHLTIQNARGRLVDYLLDHVVSRDGGSATIHLEVPRHVIAARLSIKPETLSRLLRSFVDDGLLRIEDRTLYVDDFERFSGLR